jgi:hypothetical protein
VDAQSCIQCCPSRKRNEGESPERKRKNKIKGGTKRARGAMRKKKEKKRNKQEDGRLKLRKKSRQEKILRAPIVSCVG